jgi:uncharacterized protein (TIRG00374 family)
LYYAFKGVSLEDFLNSLKKTNYFWLTLSLLAGVIEYISRAIRWRLLIKPLNYHPPVKNVFFALMVGYTANFAFPRIGEITRCATLRKSDKVPIDSLLGTVLMERAIDLFVLILIFLYVFFVKVGVFGQFISEKIFLPLKNALSRTFDLSLWSWLLVILIVVFVFTGIYLLFKKFSKEPLVKKIKKILKGVISGLKTIAKMEDRWKFIFHTIVIWIMYFLMAYLLFFALPSTSVLKPIDGLFIMIIAGIGLSLPIQGGIGVYHILVSSALMIYGIPKTNGVAYATLSHESQALLIIMLGAFSFIMLMIQNKKSKQKYTQNELSGNTEPKNNK